jgi:hypothetical protein
LEVGGALRSRLGAEDTRLRQGYGAARRTEGRRQRTEGRDQPPSLKLRRAKEDRRQEAYAVGGWRSAALEVGGNRAQLSRASRHVATPSLGQDATLSLIVRGREQERLIRKLENEKMS